jgi:nitroimidazol reductase NimA-like FMN-containing flavoprotein (pyridoxamine 5'-phosphate oxidase superfamily)
MQTRFDSRFSQAEAEATPWPDAVAALEAAELYWITTVRADGRPHVTPLVGVWHDGAMHFTTGPEEQKHRNLDGNAQVALTTGVNTWQEGLDVVVEGEAVRLRGRETLQRVADAYVAKYGDAWRFEATEETFGDGEHAANVFRIHASKILAFAKAPHGQTAFRF